MNYETNAVRLYIFNTETQLSHWTYKARQYCRTYPLVSEATTELADLLRETFTDTAATLLDHDAGPFAELLGAALGSVAWHELAREVIEYYED
jgi:hypothetical protein